jgi:hypothetical protein
LGTLSLRRGGFGSVHVRPSRWASGRGRGRAATCLALVTPAGHDLMLVQWPAAACHRTKQSVDVRLARVHRLRRLDLSENEGDAGQKIDRFCLAKLWFSPATAFILLSGWFVETGAYETLFYMSGSQCLDRPPTFRAGTAATFTHDPESKTVGRVCHRAE